MSDQLTGVLLVQLGTPQSTSTRDVRRYLREFLSDPRVLDIPSIGRWLLLNAVILPFRPRRSAEAYEKIWTADGSPLTIHTQALADGVQQALGDGYHVAVGMRYQKPPLTDAIDTLVAAECSRLVVVPLFPQYASASSGSALEATLRAVAGRWNVPNVTSVGDFYDDPRFLDAVAAVAAPELERFGADHVLFSYHGLPESQIRRSDPTGDWCLAAEGCCDTMTSANRFCYRAQAFATTRGLVERLGLDPQRVSTAFQSRLAGQKWIEPYTDREFTRLHSLGHRRLAVLTPSFTADCLETIEEIGIRGRDQWGALGGELLLVPCVNAHPTWVAGVADLVRELA